MNWSIARGRNRRRVAAGLAGVLAGLTVVLAPHPANAQIIPDPSLIPCPTDITEWVMIAPPIGFPSIDAIWEGHRYTFNSSTPRFAISDIQILDNTGSSLPTEHTITSERTETHTVSVTVGVEASGEGVLDFLKANVSVNVVRTVTTKLGVSFRQTIPPHTRFTAEYGVEVHDVSYNIEAWRVRNKSFSPPPPGSMCKPWGLHPQSTVAPTLAETWRLRTG